MSASSKAWTISEVWLLARPGSFEHDVGDRAVDLVGERAEFLAFHRRSIPQASARPPGDRSGSLPFALCRVRRRARIPETRRKPPSVAVKIRLMRVGKKKQPTYRVVVADGRSPRDGRFIEIIGQYAPRQEPSFCQIDADSALAWLRKGAQPTEQVQKLLTAQGVWAQYEAERTKPATPSCRAGATSPARLQPAAKTARRPAAPAAAARPAEALDEPSPADEAARAPRTRQPRPPPTRTPPPRTSA